MPESLEIIFELQQVNRFLRDAQSIVVAVRQVNQATAAGPGGGGGGFGGGTFGQLGARATRAAGAIAAFAAAVAAAVAVVNRMTEAGRQFADARLLGGGTTAQTAAVTTMLGAIGIQAADVASLASRLRENIAGGGFARQAASELGVGAVLPGIFGSTNDIAILNQVIDSLARIGDEEKIRQLARRLEAPELTRIVQMSKEQVGYARQLAQVQAQIFGPDAQRRLTQAAIAWQLLLQAMQIVVIQWTDFILRVFGPLAGITGQSFIDSLNGALNQNTQALNQNTVAIGNLRQIFGGGERARGALPAGFRGELLRKQAESDALKLGAFKL